MSPWRRLASLFGRTKVKEGRSTAFTFYVRCQACGEIIHVRVNPQWDLAPVWDEPPVAHRLDKEVRGIRCPRLMMIHVTFDQRCTILSQEAENATLVTADEYLAAQSGT